MATAMTYPCGPENDGPTTTPEEEAFLDWLDAQGMTIEEYDTAPLLPGDAYDPPVGIGAYIDRLTRQHLTTREAIERAEYDDSRATERRIREQEWRDAMTGDVMP